MTDRPIIKTIRVQPGLNVVIEDSHNILLEITTPGGELIARSGALTNIDNLEQALHAARMWVLMEENPPTMDEVLADWTAYLANASQATAEDTNPPPVTGTDRRGSRTNT